MRTAGDIARALGKDIRTIRRWIERGELAGANLGGRWYVFPSSTLGALVAGEVDLEAALARA